MAGSSRGRIHFETAALLAQVGTGGQKVGEL
jgi:hypothetical protein